MRTDRALLRVRNSMTPGQRWTSVLAMILVIVVLAFGLPSRLAFFPEYAAAGPSGTGAGAPAPPGTPPASAPLGPLLQPPIPGIPDTGFAAPGLSLAPLSSAAPATVVALTEPGTPVATPRDDDARAKAALATAVFKWVEVADSGTAPTVCAKVSRAGGVVLAAHELSLSLERCLLTAGVVVVSPSPRGTRRAPGGGLSLSLRRGDVASLGDLATWAQRLHPAPGRVGLVLDAARRTDLTAAVSVVRQHGLDVAATAWLGSSSSASAVLDAIRQFEAAKVRTVVFGVPVAVQQRWVAAAASPVAAFSYLVSDVDDGVVDERYPPTFDGALAHTSLRVPWYSRDHGPTADQEFCATQWTSKQTPPVELYDEQVPVDEWCEGVSLLNSAINGAVFGVGNLASLLLALRMSSPLTSDLAPLPDAMWGPTADAVLGWHASCTCWQEKGAFANRS
jgi:hypothetical protein